MRAVSMLILLLAACNDQPDPQEPLPQELSVQLVAQGLNDPVHLAAPAGDSRLFVVEQPGRIRIIQNGQLLATPFLDIRSRVRSGGEEGLLSVAFHPSYATNGFFYVNYTDLNGNSHTERYTVSSDPNVANPASASAILTVPHPEFGNHNGGQIAFAPDGKLLIGLGDGGSGGDPNNNGQNRMTLLGDLLRIDVDAGSPYAIPSDNPYAASTSLRGEIWASGLRNPWRFSIDATANVLYIADVGQGAWEEINAVPSGAAAINYGWRLMEGAHCFNPSQNCDRTGLTLPVHEYSNAPTEVCAVTGGHVYRGTAIPGVVGHYFYSDYCGGFLRSFRLNNNIATDHREWDVGDLGNVTSFGIDAARELYILSADGRVHRLVP
jgi:glucose/arabinose dehydrogenase